MQNTVYEIVTQLHQHTDESTDYLLMLLQSITNSARSTRKIFYSPQKKKVVNRLGLEPGTRSSQLQVKIISKWMPFAGNITLIVYEGVSKSFRTKS
jgi:hypothetical protein